MLLAYHDLLNPLSDKEVPFIVCRSLEANTTGHARCLLGTVMLHVSGDIKREQTTCFHERNLTEYYVV